MLDTETQYDGGVIEVVETFYNGRCPVNLDLAVSNPILMICFLIQCYANNYYQFIPYSVPPPPIYCPMQYIPFENVTSYVYYCLH